MKSKMGKELRVEGFQGSREKRVGRALTGGNKSASGFTWNVAGS
jgi:hypothetical protein